MIDAETAGPMDARSDEVWADEGGMSLRVTAIDAGHVRVEIKAGIGGEVIQLVTLGRWRWDRLVSAIGPWRPMETAPKDGTRVLLFARDKYYPPHPMQPLIASWSSDSGDGKPYWRWQVPGYTSQVLPTHWMPLPPDPEEVTP